MVDRDRHTMRRFSPGMMVKWFNHSNVTLRSVSMFRHYDDDFPLNYISVNRNDAFLVTCVSKHENYLFIVPGYSWIHSSWFMDVEP